LLRPVLVLARHKQQAIVMSSTETPVHSSGRRDYSASRPTSFSHGAKRRMFILASATALALSGGFFFVHRNKMTAEARLAEIVRTDAAEPPRVDVITAAPAPARQTLNLPGETAAWYDSKIYARVSGYVDKWFVDIGDRVKIGQTLATIDTPELDAELLAAKAKLSASEAEVVVKQARADFARTTYERWRDSPHGVVSEQEREDKKAGSAESNAELAAARAQVVLDQAEVDRLTTLTNFKQVQAPFDGTITERQIDLGDLVAAGSTANTSLLYKLSKDDPIRVFVPIPQSAAAQLMKVGTPAVVTWSDHSNQRFEGKVARTAKAINPRARTLRAEIDLPNPDHTLLPGLYVQVSFSLKNSGLIQIPAAALLFRSGGPQVAVITEKGAVEIKDVTIARDDGNVVQIGSGLATGDKVALNLSNQILAGERVAIDETDKVKSKNVAASLP
jgi:RND family efflux transporter MFP subunit